MTQFAYQPSYRRNLPHVQPRGATLFVTFCLDGALPKSIVSLYAQERRRLTRLKIQNPILYAQCGREFEKRWFSKFEALLDGERCGPVWLRRPDVAAEIAAKMHEYDSKLYSLRAFSIMPNHVHSLFKPLPVSPANDEFHSLSSIMQLWKGSTSHSCNQLMARTGQFWQHESYDHYVRDGKEDRRILNYILNNPVKAGLVGEWRLWRWNYCSPGLIR